MKRQRTHWERRLHPVERGNFVERLPRDSIAKIDYELCASDEADHVYHVVVCVDDDGGWEAYMPVRGGWRVVGVYDLATAEAIDARADKLASESDADPPCRRPSPLWY